MREVLKEYVHVVVKKMVFKEIAIDESGFGRRVKRHRGNPWGNQLWVVGIIERSSNRLILYPVDARDADTLRTIIKTQIYFYPYFLPPASIMWLFSRSMLD